MTERLSDIFRRSPQEALEEKFRRAKHSLSPEAIFVYQSKLGTCKKVRYGSFKAISRKQLEGRVYEIEFLDYDVSIFWKDVLHDPKTYKEVPIGETNG